MKESKRRWNEPRGGGREDEGERRGVEEGEWSTGKQREKEMKSGG